VEVECAVAPLGAGLDRGGVWRYARHRSGKHARCWPLHWIYHGERELQQGGLEVGISVNGRSDSGQVGARLAVVKDCEG